MALDQFSLKKQQNKSGPLSLFQMHNIFPYIKGKLFIPLEKSSQGEIQLYQELFYLFLDTFWSKTSGSGIILCSNTQALKDSICCCINDLLTWISLDAGLS